MTSAPRTQADASTLSGAGLRPCVHGVILSFDHLYFSKVTVSGRTATIHTYRLIATVLPQVEPVWPFGGLGFYFLMEPSHWRQVGHFVSVSDKMAVFRAAKHVVETVGQAAALKIRDLLIQVEDNPPYPADEESQEKFFLTLKFPPHTPRMAQ